MLVSVTVTFFSRPQQYRKCKIESCIFCIYLIAEGYSGCKNELRTPLVGGAQGYQRFLLSKPGVGQNIALHALPVDRTFTYLVSAFLFHRIYFIFPQTSPILNSGMCLHKQWIRILLVVPVHFASSWYCLFVYWRLIAPPTAQGHLRTFTKHAHYINIKHTNIIRKLVPSVLLS